MSAARKPKVRVASILYVKGLLFFALALFIKYTLRWQLSFQAVRELKFSQFDGDCCYYRLRMVLSKALLGFLEIERTVDKSDVREGLRVVA